MNVLRDARLIMDWSEERCAATCGIGVMAYKDMERDTAWDSPTPWYVIDAMERRGLKVERDNDGTPVRVIPPEEDTDLLQIWFPDKVIELLRRIEQAGEFGMALTEAAQGGARSGYNSLLHHQFCEIGAVFETAIFEGHRVQRLQPRHRRIRISRIGKAYLGLLDREKAA